MLLRCLYACLASGLFSSSLATWTEDGCPAEVCAYRLKDSLLTTYIQVVLEEEMDKDAYLQQIVATCQREAGLGAQETEAATASWQPLPGISVYQYSIAIPLNPDQIKNYHRVAQECFSKEMDERGVKCVSFDLQL